MDGQAATSRGIHKAMRAVMEDVGAIGKDRKNPQQGYSFRGIDDVMAALQPLFVKHGIICTPRVLTHEREVLQTKSGGSMASVRLLVEHTYEAADGSTAVSTTFGEAMDSGDKASNKAMSAALKYSHTFSFCIPTYEKLDTEEASPEMGAPAPRPVSRPAASPGAAQKPTQATQQPRPASKPSSGAVLPNYGRNKGQPVAGQKVSDLQFYAEGCRKSLGDPSKARWHEKEQTLLQAIEDEIAAQTGGTQPHSADEPPPPGDDDAPF